MRGEEVEVLFLGLLELVLVPSLLTEGRRRGGEVDCNNPPRPHDILELWNQRYGLVRMSQSNRQ